MSKEFFGRRLVRWALIVPWAASLVMTSQLFRILYAATTACSAAVHLVAHQRQPTYFLDDDQVDLPSMIVVGIFVSLAASRRTCSSPA